MHKIHKPQLFLPKHQSLALTSSSVLDLMPHYHPKHIYTNITLYLKLYTCMVHAGVLLYIYVTTLTFLCVTSSYKYHYMTVHYMY